MFAIRDRFDLFFKTFACSRVVNGQQNFFAGLTSLINLYEAPIATVQEKFHLGRVAACGVIGVIGVVVSLLIQGIVSQWMDVLSIYICPLGAGLAGVMFFWICGKKYVQSQVDKGRSSK